MVFHRGGAGFVHGVQQLPDAGAVMGGQLPIEVPHITARHFGLSQDAGELFFSLMYHSASLHCGYVSSPFSPSIRRGSIINDEIRFSVFLSVSCEKERVIKEL